MSPDASIDIFLSFASEDESRARKAAGALEEQGWSVFWDRTIPAGRTSREVITTALEKARCMVVMWSAVSIRKRWVLEEADEGVKRNILVPVLIEKVEPPLGFKSIQWADLSNWDGTTETTAFQKLVTDIGLILAEQNGAETDAKGRFEEEEENGNRAEEEARHKVEEDRKQVEVKPKRSAQKGRRKAKAKVERKEEHAQAKADARITAKSFGRLSHGEWTKILKELDKDPARYGMPEGGREKSLILASLNSRKLGGLRNRTAELDFLARFCACCDLIAIQEIQDNLDGLQYLKERTEAHVAGEGEYALAFSDVTGSVPGAVGISERLAFLYRHRRVRHLGMASDLTYDRTTILNRVFENETVILQEFHRYKQEMSRYLKGELERMPTHRTPAFVTFVRTPYVAAFEAYAANDQPPLRFTAVNAHLVFGTMRERAQEYQALLDWIILQLKVQKRSVGPNIILLGDLNLNFDNPEKEQPVIENHIRQINEQAFGDRNERRVYFPFIDPHPSTGKHHRSNARINVTFDQIAFFKAKDELRIPNDTWREMIRPQEADGFDYGVFNFVELFAQSLKGKSYDDLTSAQRNDLAKKYEHSVSDHLPLWVRLPRPGFAPLRQV